MQRIRRRYFRAFIYWFSLVGLLLHLFSAIPTQTTITLVSATQSEPDTESPLDEGIMVDTYVTRPVLVMETAPLTTNANLGDTIELVVQLQNKGNADAEDVWLLVDGGMTLSATAQQLELLPAGDSQDIQIPLQVNGRTAIPQILLVTVTAANLVAPIQADTIVAFEPSMETLTTSSRWGMVEGDFPQKLATCP